jgi:hypothetical protein
VPTPTPRTDLPDKAVFFVVWAANLKKRKEKGEEKRKEKGRKEKGEKEKERRGKGKAYITYYHIIFIATRYPSSGERDQKVRSKGKILLLVSRQWQQVQ